MSNREWEIFQERHADLLRESAQNAGLDLSQAPQEEIFDEGFYNLDWQLRNALVAEAEAIRQAEIRLADLRAAGNGISAPDTGEDFEDASFDEDDDLFEEEDDIDPGETEEAVVTDWPIYEPQRVY